MKKGVFRITSIALILVFMLVLVPVTVSASDFSWNTGTQVTLNMDKTPAPSWLQIFSEGVKITGAAKICHPFNKGLDNWVGLIYELKDGKWTKLPTTMSRPSDEGAYMACANATEAGTYALFGYYKSTKVTPTAVAPSLSGEWNTGTEVDLNMDKYPAPSWAQLWSKAGIKVPAKTKLCHPFNQAQYRWTPIIMQFVDKKWVKMDAATSLTKTDDGGYKACVYAANAGTYALFGYYK